MKNYTTPLTDRDVMELRAGDMITISGEIFAGRDAVLPKLVAMLRDGSIEGSGIELRGSVVFHTAVSPAGVGPTSSNKLEIESSIAPLSEAGIRLHLGKGQISRETIEQLDRHHAVYAVIPPVTALLGDRTLEHKLAAFPELGMEALYRLKVDRYPCIIAAAHGRSVYDRGG